MYRQRVRIHQKIDGFPNLRFRQLDKVLKLLQFVIAEKVFSDLARRK